eukprot:SAG31_NODE_19783_length_591_cov_2.142276_2_plen_127_part_01
MEWPTSAPPEFVPQPVRDFLDLVEDVTLTAATQEADAARRKLAQVALEAVGGIPPHQPQAATWSDWQDLLSFVVTPPDPQTCGDLVTSVLAPAVAQLTRATTLVGGNFTSEALAITALWRAIIRVRT